MNIFRINGFTIIQKKYSLLTEQEALYLAQMDGISKMNQRAYLNFMTDGQVFLLLMTRVNGILIAKTICNAR